MTAEPYCPEPPPERDYAEDPDAEDHGLDPWDYDIGTLQAEWQHDQLDREAALHGSEIDF